MFEIGSPRSRGRKNFGRSRTRGMRGLENWTIFMEVICVSSLKKKYIYIYILKHNNPKKIYKHIYTPRNAATKSLRLIDAVVVP